MLWNILNIKIKDKVRLTEIYGECEAGDIEWVIKKLKPVKYLVRGKDLWNKIVKQWSPRYWKKKKEDLNEGGETSWWGVRGLLGQSQKGYSSWKKVMGGQFPHQGGFVGAVTTCTSCSWLYMACIDFIVNRSLTRSQGWSQHVIRK